MKKSSFYVIDGLYPSTEDGRYLDTENSELIIVTDGEEAKKIFTGDVFLYDKNGQKLYQYDHDTKTFVEYSENG